MTIPQLSKRSSIFRRGMLLRLLRHPKMVGGVESCWMKRGGRKDDIYFQVILFVYSRFVEVTALNLVI